MEDKREEEAKQKQKQRQMENITKERRFFT
jgi:hypothetical protein